MMKLINGNKWFLVKYKEQGILRNAWRQARDYKQAIHQHKERNPEHEIVLCRQVKAVGYYD